MTIKDWIEKGKRIGKKRERHEGLKNVVIGAAVGLTTGVAAGILWAPKSGEETRKDIAATIKDIPAKTKDILEMSRVKIEEGKDKLMQIKTNCAAEDEVK